MTFSILILILVFSGKRSMCCCVAMNKDQWDPEFLKAIPIMKTRSGMQVRAAGSVCVSVCVCLCVCVCVSLHLIIVYLSGEILYIRKQLSQIITYIHLI